MSGKIVANANLISPSSCTSVSPNYGLFPLRVLVYCIHSVFFVFFSLKIVHTTPHNDTVKDVFLIFENILTIKKVKKFGKFIRLQPDRPSEICQIAHQQLC